MPKDQHALLIGINDYPWIKNANLKGCINDLHAMHQTLKERFRFPPPNIIALGNEQATRAAIRSAFATVFERIRKGDIVTIFYAGHGSRVAAPETSSGYRESIVPHDSGRQPHPNRDIEDRELDYWVHKFNTKTSHVHLIFDCCHSGAVTRESSGLSFREVPPDHRPRTAENQSYDTEDNSANTLCGWIPSSRDAVVLAACRAEELASEHRFFAQNRVHHHGALSYFLGQVFHRLVARGQDITWHDIFALVAPLVTQSHRHQHPQLEGRVDEILFSPEKK